MKKVGIVTLHYNYNFGAVLQCYALKKAINRLEGVKAEIINYVPTKFRNLNYLDVIHNGKHLQQIEKFNLFRCNTLKIQTGAFSAIVPGMVKEYDYFIAGSDQIWNPDFAFDSAYFLDFAPIEAVKLAYAASIGKPLTGLTEKHKEIFEKYIPDFDFISLREKSYINYIRQFTQKKVTAVLDPTLLLDVSDYEKLMANFPISNQWNQSDKYILLYFINHDTSAPQILSFVNKIVNKYGYKVIHSFAELPAGVLKNDSGSFKFAGPEEFLKLVKNAEMVITNSFHGTVFSILFGKPFYSFIVQRMAARIYDLLESLGLCDRIVEGYKALGEISLNINYVEVQARLEELKKHSMDFLKCALGLR